MAKLISIILIICYVTIANCLISKNICKDAIKFRFNSLQVNSVYEYTLNYNLHPIEQYLIEEFDFEEWDDAPINTTELNYLKLYNSHIYTIHYNQFYTRYTVKEMTQYRNYIRVILNKFISNRNQLDELKHDVYRKKLNEIIKKMRTGYELVNLLISTKDGYLTDKILPEIELQKLIDNLSLSNDQLFIFRDQKIRYYYQFRLIKSEIKRNDGSPKYLSPKANYEIKLTLSIPIHEKNYDSTSMPCLTLKDLPVWYQSTESFNTNYNLNRFM